MKRNGFVQIFKDFSNWSTVAAVPHISNASTKVSRIFWILVFCGVVGMFAYELYILISKFLSYPAVVDTEILFEKQTFPVVTVCNINPYKYNIVKSKSSFNGVKKLMQVYENALKGNYDNDDYGINQDQEQSYDMEERTADALILEAFKITDDEKESALYSYSELIQDCTFSGKPCSASDFTRFIDPVYGACYSFNEDAALNYSVSREGILFGLKLMITTSKSTSESSSEKLPNVNLAGVRIAITSRGSMPMLDSNGIDIGVGYESAVSISLVKNLRAKAPYGNCVDREPEKTDYYKDFTYTLETCFRGCKQRDTVEQCGCSNPRYAIGPNDNICEPEKATLNCLQRLKGSQTNEQDPNINLLTECSCNPPCQELTYTPTVSLAKFPSKSYYVATDGEDGAGSCTSSNSKFGSRKKCHSWYENNALTLQVFFETISYELYTERPGYTISNAINDLGGQAGLWLGLSVISCVEMFGLLLVMGAFCVTGGGIKIRPDDDDIENDDRIKDVEDVKKEIDRMKEDESDKKNE